jgi:hypothetical protein
MTSPAAFLLPLALALTFAIACGPAHAQRTATATAVVTNGTVVAVTVTDGGAGYTAAPKIALGGAGGSGATATALVVDGVVTAIQVLSAGQGFTNAPSVGIAPPDAARSALSIQPGPQIAIIGNLGATVELQASDSLGPETAWSGRTTVQLTHCPYGVNDLLGPGITQRFYRAVERQVERPVAPADFVWLPAARFAMGTAASDPVYLVCEGPQTQVRLSQGFFLCQHEVTQAEYAAVVGNNPASFTDDPNLPVESVT